MTDLDRQAAPAGWSPADAEDRQAMIRLVTGQGTALNELMERHAEKLFHYLLRALQDEQDAADLAQEAFTRVYQNSVRYDPRQKFSTWLYAIASNLVRDRYRWRRRHPQVSLNAPNEASGEEFAAELPDNSRPALETLLGRERAAEVRQAVAELPEFLRIPLLLAEYEEKPHAEIAVILGCSTKAVEKRVYRARCELRERLGHLLEPV